MTNWHANIMRLTVRGQVLAYIYIGFCIVQSLFLAVALAHGYLFAAAWEGFWLEVFFRCLEGVMRRHQQIARPKPATATPMKCKDCGCTVSVAENRALELILGEDKHVHTLCFRCTDKRLHK